MTKLDSHETKTAFAARVGLTKGRISQLVAEGLPVRADGRIDVAVGLAWIENGIERARDAGDRMVIEAGYRCLAAWRLGRQAPREDWSLVRELGAG